jgi:methionine biosynthesis protein MetW
MATANASVYDELVAAGGLADAHRLLIDAVPDGSRVLDVGCASGYLAEALQRDKDCQVTGLEYDPRAVEDARARGVDARCVNLDVDPIDGDGYDVVIFADVLEHLREPARVLESVHAAPLVLVSLPNVAHWTARRQLLWGRWPNDDHGIFDRTHLHFFTRDSAHALARGAGYAVAQERHTEWLLPLESRLGLPRAWRQRAADWRPTLFAFQFVLTLK